MIHSFSKLCTVRSDTQVKATTVALSTVDKENFIFIFDTEIIFFLSKLIAVTGSKNRMYVVSRMKKIIA